MAAAILGAAHRNGVAPRPFNYPAMRFKEALMLVKVNATLVDPTAVASLDGFTAELFDTDPLSSSLLAKGTVTAHGRI